jgi:hypothetical protein
MTRVAAVCALLALLVPAAVARAQGNPFGPVPQGAPAQAATPTPVPTSTPDSGSTGRTTLFVIGGGLLVAFAAMAVFIARDARRSLPEDKRPTGALREEGAHRHKRAAKAQARAKGRAQKAARRRNRAA